MTLTLVVKGLDRLDNGEAARLTLDRHGAVIGRSPHADWSLPDPRSHISSSHCEIDFRDGAYSLVDRSTNGTFVNGSPNRLTEPYRIADGDVITIGHYVIEARLGGEAGLAARASSAEPSWGGWDSHIGSAPEPLAPSQWDRPAPQPAISGRGPLSENWAAPRAAAPPPAPPTPSVWDSPAAPAPQPSAWSSPVSEAPAAPSAVDVWGQLAASNTVDWGRGGFASPAASPPAATAKDPFGLERPSPAQPSSSAAAWGAPVSTHAAPLSAGGGGELSAFLAAAGLAPGDLKAAPSDTLSAAGGLLKRLVAGMVVMLEARARAKAQLGAQGTSLEFDGNNPLKFARGADKALAQLLNPPERGFMPAERAIEDAFLDLQAHQMATLAAMQGALAATLARFSPDSIRKRAETRGILAKIIPSAREATLWQAYEREFEGVAKGSDEAFMDIFAKEFRQAYERVAADMKQKR